VVLVVLPRLDLQFLVANPRTMTGVTRRRPTKKLLQHTTTGRNQNTMKKINLRSTRSTMKLPATTGARRLLRMMIGPVVVMKSITKSITKNITNNIMRSHHITRNIMRSTTRSIMKNNMKNTTRSISMKSNLLRKMTGLSNNMKSTMRNIMRSSHPLKTTGISLRKKSPLLKNGEENLRTMRKNSLLKKIGVSKKSNLLAMMVAMMVVMMEDMRVPKRLAAVESNAPRFMTSSPRTQTILASPLEIPSTFLTGPTLQVGGKDKMLMAIKDISP